MTQRPKKTLKIELGESNGKDSFNINLIATVSVNERMPKEEENIQFCVNGIPYGNPISTNRGRATQECKNLPKGNYAFDAFIVQSGESTMIKRTTLGKEDVQKIKEPEGVMTYFTKPISKKIGEKNIAGLSLNIFVTSKGEPLKNSSVYLSNISKDMVENDHKNTNEHGYVSFDIFGERATKVIIRATASEKISRIIHLFFERN